MRTYLTLLSLASIRSCCLAAFIARLPMAMTPLGLLILVEAATGSYASGGLVSGAFAVGTAIAAPGWGRALDARSHGRIMMLTGTVSAFFLLIALAAARLGFGLLPIAGSALMVGLFFPPVTPAMRLAWRHLTADRPGLLASAYALDAVAVEALFVIGPMLVGLLYSGGPALPVVASAVFLLAGGLFYATTPAGKIGGEHENDQLTKGGRTVIIILPVLLIAMALSLGFGQMDVAMTATAQARSSQGYLLGLLFAVAASGSISGGLAFGAREWKTAPRILLPLFLGGFGLGLAGAATALFAGLPVLILLPLLYVAGLFVSPSLILMQQMIDHALPRGRTAEGQSWLAAVLTAGSAAGMAFGGFVADHGPPPMVFLSASVILAGGSMIAMMLGRIAKTDQSRVG
ncbi:MFS transporter [Martelella alba]|uniref:MFS transporter n=1 Tax=Martelella alba TaxID=2590451 RepID=A0A506U5L8_9HYPH|nr:MFS transporter [Martelella alba]TPW29150.1 MFS transporter [Martelella alba]